METLDQLGTSMTNVAPHSPSVQDILRLMGG
jgi:hypothetical protein